MQEPLQLPPLECRARASWVRVVGKARGRRKPPPSPPKRRRHLPLRRRKPRTALRHRRNGRSTSPSGGGNRGLPSVSAFGRATFPVPSARRRTREGGRAARPGLPPPASLRSATSPASQGRTPALGRLETGDWRPETGDWSLRPIFQCSASGRGGSSTRPWRSRLVRRCRGGRRADTRSRRGPSRAAGLRPPGRKGSRRRGRRRTS